MVFFFTLSHDQGGGWVKVIAADSKVARKAFQIWHPDTPDGFISCAGIYTAEEFRRTNMFQAGNFGKRCVETITFLREEMSGT